MESEAYIEGYEAWEDGAPSHANPYHPFDDYQNEFTDWDEGWHDAAAELGEE